MWFCGAWVPFGDEIHAGPDGDMTLDTALQGLELGDHGSKYPCYKLKLREEVLALANYLRYYRGKSSIMEIDQCNGAISFSKGLCTNCSKLLFCMAKSTDPYGN